MLNTSDKNFHYVTAISRLGVAIEYLAWACQTNDLKDRLHWTAEAKHMINVANEWIEKELPF